MLKGILLFLLFCTTAAAQIKILQTKQKPHKSAPPVFAITFQENPDFPAMPWSSDWPGPIQGECIGNGGLYVWRWPSGQGFAAFTAKGIVTYLSDKMSDIPHPDPDSGSISESGVYILTSGMENPKEEPFSAEDEQGHELKLQRTTGDRHQFLARFDRDGTYQGSIKLDLPFEVFSLAVFNSATFVAQGLDENKIPRVALLNSSGQFMRYLDLKKDLSASSEIPADVQKLGKNKSTTVGALAMLSNFTPARTKYTFSAYPKQFTRL